MNRWNQSYEIDMGDFVLAAMGALGSRVVTTSGKVKNTGNVRTTYVVSLTVVHKGTDGNTKTIYATEVTGIVLNSGDESASSISLRTPAADANPSSIPTAAGEKLEITLALNATNPPITSALDTLTATFTESLVAGELLEPATGDKWAIVVA